MCIYIYLIASAAIAFELVYVGEWKGPGFRASNILPDPDCDLLQRQGFCFFLSFLLLLAECWDTFITAFTLEKWGVELA